jgi:molecular chaperone GrpE
MEDGVAEQKQEQPQSEQEEALEEVVKDGETTPEEEALAAESADAPEEELSLEEKVVRLAEEAAGARDTALRAQADAQNVQRRAEQDVERARKFALEQFAKELLAVVDNMERALEATDGLDDDVVKPITEGVELTLKSFLAALKKFNVEAVDPQGEPFDPNLHQAMSMVENNDVEPNSVIAVMQKGYTLNGRLLRPAMVMVSKAAS